MLRYEFRACSILVAALVCVPVAARADRVDDMISPVSMPTVNEDPRITTEVRPLYFYHGLSDDFVTGGGDLQVFAVQARIAITDRIGFIATKDGYAWLKPDDLLPDEDGWANVAFGFKGSLYQDDDAGSIFSLGLRYEAPWGNREVFQGNGDGVLNPFLSAAQALGDANVQFYSGPRVPLSGGDSTFWDTAFHVDYRLGQIYPLMEINWVHVVDGGRRLPLVDEGFDIVNFGSSRAGGNSIVTMALGTRYRVCDWIDVGATGEFPLTGTRDVWGWRVTGDIIIRPFGWDAPWTRGSSS